MALALGGTGARAGRGRRVEGVPGVGPTRAQGPWLSGAPGPPVSAFTPRRSQGRGEMSQSSTRFSECNQRTEGPARPWLLRAQRGPLGREVACPWAAALGTGGVSLPQPRPLVAVEGREAAWYPHPASRPSTGDRDLFLFLFLLTFACFY